MDQRYTSPSLWRKWMDQPQKIWPRRVLFQVHLWSGIVLGLYVLLMSVTGGVLVYANEMYRASTLKPHISTGTGPRLTEEQLVESARRAYPDYSVGMVMHPTNPDQAAEIVLELHGVAIKHMFDVRTGVDLGDAVPPGIKFVSAMIDLHDNLKAGPTGRMVNGLGALALLVLILSGMVVWWPGSKNWKRSVTLSRGMGWKRFVWQSHSVVGFWSLAYLIVFAVSGIYLCNPNMVQDFADWLQPVTPENAGVRIVDKAIYWLAFLHFGRIQGIGIPCKGPGVCDQTTKAVWALFGFAPAVMFLTGTIMWWNRVIRPRLAKGS